MAVIRTPLPNAAFTLIRNCWVRDSRISFKAKGLLAYLVSHSEGYACSQAQMVRESADGKDAIRSALDELEGAGYLTRVPTRSAGRFAEDDYALTDPFDADGRIIRLSHAQDGRETRQSGLPAAGKPLRQIRPIEEHLENTKTPTGSISPDEELFAAFWAAYPKKVGKDAARRAWRKATRRADPDKIVEVVSRYPFRGDRQFVKDPSTWLNAGCWEDDLDAVAAANRGTTVRPSGYRPAYQNPDPSADPDIFARGF